MHEIYLGLGKCKLRANETVYWPGLNDQLKKLVLNCELCLKYSHSKHKQKPSTSLGQEIPVHPWSKLATDIFHCEGASSLLIVDYSSRYPVVCKLSAMTGVHVANQCKLVFWEYGWPETLISDNGLCYTSQAFTSVMKAFSVNHITSSLHYSQSNGFVEKYMQIVECLFYKANEEDKDQHRCVIYHPIPLTGSLQSPMQILLGRNARSDLPMCNAARKQLGIQSERIRKVDKHKVLPTCDLHVGQCVMYQYSVTKQWHPVVITSWCQEKRSYMVTTSNCVVSRKMQAHLKPYAPQNKKSQSTQGVSQPMAQLDHVQPVKQSDHKKSSQVNYQLQVHTNRPKRDTRPLVKLDL